MSKITVQVEVEEKSYEVAEALKSLIKSAKEALADGFQPGTDIPVVVAANFTKLLKAISDVSALPGESAEDPEAFMKAFGLAGLEVAGLFLKKTPAVAVAEPAVVAQAEAPAPVVAGQEAVDPAPASAEPAAPVEASEPPAQA